MKKLLKVLSLMVVSVALVVGIVAFAGCGGNDDKNDGSVTLTGEYHYANAWDATAPDYGIKVEVKYKDNTVQKVTVVSSDYVSVTASWENKATWDNGLANLLKSYEGKSIKDVMTWYGEIKNVDGADADYIAEGAPTITGATQGSVRLLKAVQNALEKADVVMTGEYHYANAWDATAPDYGIKVQITVSMEDAKIKSVKVLESNYVSVTATWENKATWDNGLANLLKSYEGKTIMEIMALQGSTIKGVDGADADKIAEGAPTITGATQGSVRLLKAVQNAYLTFIGMTELPEISD